MAEQTMVQAGSSPALRWGRWLIGGAIYLALLIIGLGFGGELGVFVGASLNVIPFVGLAILAYFAGQRFNWVSVACGIWLVILVGGVAVNAFGTSTLAILGTLPRDANPSDPEVAAKLATANIPGLLLGLIGAIGIGSLTLVPPLRRGLARVMPLDPAMFTHTVALMVIVTITLIMLVPLIILGEPPVLALIRQSGESVSGLSNASQLRAQIYGLVWIIPAALFAVGFGIRRNLAATLTRLGVVRPTLPHLAIGAGIGLVMALVVHFALPLQVSLWQTLGWPTTDQEAFAKLMAFALSPIGAIVIGITAGVGEELAVRGVLQPRMGLWLSNLFFTSLHAFQYHWDALLVVFVVGLICGVVRNRFNTTTAALVHGVYNCVLILLAVALA